MVYVVVYGVCGMVYCDVLRCGVLVRGLVAWCGMPCDGLTWHAACCGVRCGVVCGVMYNGVSWCGIVVCVVRHGAVLWNEASYLGRGCVSYGVVWRDV